MKDKLTPKQELFCREYLVDFNGTKAAVRAGYSPKTAQEQSSQLLSKLIVQQRVKALMDERVERVELTADAVLAQLKNIIFFDPRKLFHDDGRPKNVTELDDETAGAVVGIDVAEQWGIGEDGNRCVVGTVRKYKVADKKGAIDSAMKHLGIQGVDKTDLTSNGKDVQVVVYLPDNGRDSQS